MTPAAARAALDTARTEAEQARALVEALAEQVRSGDETVTAEQIGEQRELADLADLRVTAAERKLTSAVAADLDARASAAGDNIRALVAEDSTEPLITAVKGVMAAVEALVQAAANREATIHETAAAGVALNGELGWSPDTPWPSDRYGFRAQNTSPVSVMALRQGRAVATPAGELLGIALAAALVGQSGIRQMAADLMTTMPGAVPNRADGVPGLMDALRYTPQEWQALGQAARGEAYGQNRQPITQEASAA
ncbi:hypothetical protein [Streptomyces candidus]|uniref:Uncharacterized protein n=1 Tax=Streptomyces candidus TaxID=67283 RepID=A0A7X0LQL9_9ACTN|nr:hypothetical protein [Streptomyces candidus]MBB6437202.1 hypothetical protein [Streptomyces candidus]GHH38194.1 hypothetical protein GCM10018773_15780 [Streptomyces candidus]